MKKKIEWLLNVCAFGLLVVLVLWRAPQWMRAYSRQGAHVEQKFMIQTLAGESLQIPSGSKKALVFWATWCGPCTLELSRIQSLIEAQRIQPSDVLAVALDHDADLVKKTVTERGYKFSVAIDVDGQLSNYYGAEVTPTIVLLNADDSIQWISSGVSPTLEFRLRHFF